ncbi:MAG: hypothetical protein ACJ8IK_27865 [Burkholderiaceae bacterium]
MPAHVQAAAPARAPAVGTPPPVAASPGDGAGTVRLRYLARAPILVRGARSGASYRFSEQQPTQGVQRADAEALLASGHFRRE